MRLTFDRGTVLLSDVPSGVDVTGICGLRWDPRVASWRAPGHRYSELAGRLAKAGKLTADEVRNVKEPKEWRDLELRPYQEDALAAWEQGGRRGVVVLPTGSGKTRVALSAMARARLSTLCLVPTRVLLEQWVLEVGRLYEGPIGCFGDGYHELEAITVATFESAYRGMARLGNRFDLLVVDEVHHFGAGVRDEALEMSIAQARLGLTATLDPQRTVGLLDTLIGPPVFELNIADLAGKHLAAFDAATLHVDLNPRERADYDALMQRFRLAQAEFGRLIPEGSWQDFAHWCGRSAEGRRALAGWRAARKLVAYPEAKREMLRTLLLRERDSRTLVFTADNDTAYAVAREHLIMPITCDIGRSERADALDRFRRGDLKALVSAQVLNEGFDVPDAEVAIVVGAALGEREHVQRVGRLLRPREGKRARVFELVTRNTIEVRQAKRRGRGLATREVTSLQHP